MRKVENLPGAPESTVFLREVMGPSGPPEPFRNDRWPALCFQNAVHRPKKWTCFFNEVLFHEHKPYTCSL